MKHMESISDKVEFSKGDIEPLIETAMTTLSSKIVNVSCTFTSETIRHFTGGIHLQLVFEFCISLHLIVLVKILFVFAWN